MSTVHQTCAGGGNTKMHKYSSTGPCPWGATCLMREAVKEENKYYKVTSPVTVPGPVWSLSRVRPCDPMNRSMPGFPVHHQLLESTKTHVHWVSAPTISSSVVPFSSCPQSFPASGSFQMSQLFASGGQSIGVSASTSVLPMNTQDWSPSGWTGWISLQSKGLSRVFSNTTVQKHQFLCAQLSS